MDRTNCSEAPSTNKEEDVQGEVDQELRKLLMPDLSHLPLTPPSAIETNFVTYFALDFMKPGTFIGTPMGIVVYLFHHLLRVLECKIGSYLCVIGLAPSHIAFKDEGGIKTVDFNVGKSDRSSVKVTGKRKRNAQHFESNTALCKISTDNDSYIVRCCVKGSLLEINEQLIRRPDLINFTVEREGYVAIIMPKPGDWLKVKTSLVSLEEYKKSRGL